MEIQHVNWIKYVRAFGSLLYRCASHRCVRPRTTTYWRYCESKYRLWVCRCTGPSMKPQKLVFEKIVAFNILFFRLGSEEAPPFQSLLVAFLASLHQIMKARWEIRESEAEIGWMNASFPTSSSSSHQKSKSGDIRRPDSSQAIFFHISLYFYIFL